MDYFGTGSKKYPCLNLHIRQFFEFLMEPIP